MEITVALLAKHLQPVHQQQKKNQPMECVLGRAMCCLTSVGSIHKTCIKAIITFAIEFDARGTEITHLTFQE